MHLQDGRPLNIKYEGYSIKTERYRLTMWGENGSDGFELYDHHNDPEELINLANTIENKLILDSLKDHIKFRVSDAMKIPPGLGRQFEERPLHKEVNYTPGDIHNIQAKEFILNHLMNRINKVFQKDGTIMSIYFTAGFPAKNDTLSIIKELDSAGVEMIEIGFLFSDPLADGPTIQKSSTIALKNGMNTITLFEQLKNLRKMTDIPVVIMGYFNPILQFGIEKFCKSCKEVGIDGLIIPDLPVDIYNDKYQKILKLWITKHVFNYTSNIRKKNKVYR